MKVFSGVVGLPAETEVVKIRAKKCSGLDQSEEQKKFCIDPKLTDFEHLRLLLAKAFNLDIESFVIFYLLPDSAAEFDPDIDDKDSHYRPMLSTWDYDYAVSLASSPNMLLKIETQPTEDSLQDWDVINLEDVAKAANAESNADARKANASVLSAASSKAAQQLSRPISPASLSLQSTASAATVDVAGVKPSRAISPSVFGSVGSRVQKTVSVLTGNNSSETSAASNAKSTPPPPPRGGPVTDADFRSFLDEKGRMVHSQQFRLAVYHGGIEPSLRRIAWRHLLNIYPEGMTGSDRIAYTNLLSDEYSRLKHSWQRNLKMGYISEELRVVANMVRKDVVRTDRTLPFYAGNEDDNENILCLFNILTTYAMTHPDVSYCQGMSDLASPILFVMKDEADAYVCFCALMQRMRKNFMCDGRSMTKKFSHLVEVLQFYDAVFFEYLREHHADDLLFCYRWLLLGLKREFAFDDALLMMEVMWSSLPPDCPKPGQRLSLSDIDIALYESRFRHSLPSTTSVLPSGLSFDETSTENVGGSCLTPTPAPFNCSAALTICEQNEAEPENSLVAATVFSDSSIDSCIENDGRNAVSSIPIKMKPLAVGKKFSMPDSYLMDRATPGDGGCATSSWLEDFDALSGGDQLEETFEFCGDEQIQTNGSAHKFTKSNALTIQDRQRQLSGGANGTMSNSCPSNLDRMLLPQGVYLNANNNGGSNNNAYNRGLCHSALLRSLLLGRNNSGNGSSGNKESHFCTADEFCDAHATIHIGSMSSREDSNPSIVALSPKSQQSADGLRSPKLDNTAPASVVMTATSSETIDTQSNAANGAPSDHLETNVSSTHETKLSNKSLRKKSFSISVFKPWTSAASTATTKSDSSDSQKTQVDDLSPQNVAKHFSSLATVGDDAEFEELPTASSTLSSNSASNSPPQESRQSSEDDVFHEANNNNSHNVACNPSRPEQLMDDGCSWDFLRRNSMQSYGDSISLQIPDSPSPFYCCGPRNMKPSEETIVADEQASLTSSSGPNSPERKNTAPTGPEAPATPKEKARRRFTMDSAKVHRKKRTSVVDEEKTSEYTWAIPVACDAAEFAANDDVDGKEDLRLSQIYDIVLNKSLVSSCYGSSSASEPSRSRHFSTRSNVVGGGNNGAGSGNAPNANNLCHCNSRSCTNVTCVTPTASSSKVPFAAATTEQLCIIQQQADAAEGAGSSGLGSASSSSSFVMAAGTNASGDGKSRTQSGTGSLGGSNVGGVMGLLGPSPMLHAIPDSGCYSDATTPFTESVDVTSSVAQKDFADDVADFSNATEKDSNALLPPPHEFGDGNPFKVFLCLTLLLQHRDHIMKRRMDYNEIAMYFDKMVRKHDVQKVLRKARQLFADYLKLGWWENTSPQREQ